MSNIWFLAKRKRKKRGKKKKHTCLLGWRKLWCGWQLYDWNQKKRRFLSSIDCGEYLCCILDKIIEYFSPLNWTLCIIMHFNLTFNKIWWYHFDSLLKCLKLVLIIPPLCKHINILCKSYTNHCLLRDDISFIYHWKRRILFLTSGRICSYQLKLQNDMLSLIRMQHVHFIFLMFNIIIYWPFNSYLLFWCWISLLSNSNADRVSWWELMVLASHVHPSVAAMARTLLSGANIVYSGNPLNDLSLSSFLDKFMEKKPRQSTWHGASQIEPAKKVCSPTLFFCFVFIFFLGYGV